MPAIDPKNVTNVKDIDFAQEGYVQAFEEYINRAVDENDSEAAFRFLRHVEPELKIRDLGNPVLVARYNAMIVKAKFICLFRLRDEEVLDLLRNHLKEGLNDFDEIAYSLIRACVNKLSGMWVEPIAIEYKEEIRKLLETDKCLITETKIQAKDKEIPGTAENWLNDYRVFIAEKELSRALGRAEYFSNSPQLKRLQKREKELAERLIEFYDWARIRLDDPEAWDQPIIVKDEKGRLVGFQNGKVEVYESVPIVRETLKWMRSQGLFNKELSMEEALSTKTGNENEKEIRTSYSEQDYDETAKLSEPFTNSNDAMSKLYADLALTMATSDAQKKIAGSLLHIASKGWLPGVLQDSRFQTILIQLIEEKFGKPELDQFKLSPIQPKYLILFLRYVLEAKLKFAESDSAKIGVKISNLIKKSGENRFAEIAYYDLAMKTFRWNE